MLAKIDRDIWIADGAPVRFLGVFPYPTRMAVIRLQGGALWVWSPIALEPTLAREVAALGEVHHLVAPNKLHHLYLADWARAFPQALLWGAPGLAAKRRDLGVHGELGDEPDSAWAADIDQVVFRGSLWMEEVVFFHRASRTALVTDLIQRFDPRSMRGVRGLLMRLDGLVGESGSTPREWRATFLNRRAARAAKREALAWDPQRLVIAHGEWVRHDGRAALERGLRWLG